MASNNRPRVSPEAQHQADMVTLLGQPAFRRFLFRVAEASGMLAPANGSEDRHLRIAEGRRSLGFDMFRWADDASSMSHTSGLPVATLAQVLRDAIQPPGGPSNVQVTDDVEDDEDDVRR